MNTQNGPWSGRLIASVATILSLCWSGCSTKPIVATHRRSLATGESTVIKVVARSHRTGTGIIVSPGERYTFTTAADDKWIDLCHPSTAAGFENPRLKKYEACRPAPQELWFTLLARVGNGPAVRAARLAQEPATTTGELGLFPNDHPDYYWNNFGSLRVTIKRVE